MLAVSAGLVASDQNGSIEPQPDQTQRICPIHGSAELAPDACRLFSRMSFCRASSGFGARRIPTCGMVAP